MATQGVFADQPAQVTCFLERDGSIYSSETTPNAEIGGAV